MRTRNLFYLLLALPLILTACDKTSNEENAPDAPSYDVTMEAKYLLAEYWGDEFTPGVDSYSIIIADNKFMMDLGGSSLPEGSYYCLDIYAPISEDGTIPVGEYRFDTTESCAEWTIDGCCSALFVVDANGNFIPDDEGASFSDATLVIGDNYAELKAVTDDGKTHFVTFSGKFAKVDSTNGDGTIIHETTLIEDVEVESSVAMFIAATDGDRAQIVVTESEDAGNGAAFMIEVALTGGGDTLSGTYSVADGTLSAGEYNSDGMYGSWYFNMIDGEVGYAYAAINDGTVTIVQDGDSCSMTLDCTDAEGYKISATLSGVLYMY